MENNENADNGGVDRSVAELRNWKAAGSIPRRERWENVLLQSQLSVPTLISVTVSPPCYRSGT